MTAVIVVLVGIMAEVAALLRSTDLSQAFALATDSIWPYSIFIFCMASIISEQSECHAAILTVTAAFLYIITVICGYVLKQRLEEIRKRSSTANVLSPKQDNQQKKFARSVLKLS